MREALPDGETLDRLTRYPPRRMLASVGDATRVSSCHGPASTPVRAGAVAHRVLPGELLTTDFLPSAVGFSLQTPGAYLVFLGRGCLEGFLVKTQSLHCQKHKALGRNDISVAILANPRQTLAYPSLVTPPLHRRPAQRVSLIPALLSWYQH